ncbi:MAG: amino acid adenylation domain-containing protein [Planctomycetes bacterium]|nr:amino acid adenylation domain-containing protein [Planctomycetota bacterium]
MQASDSARFQPFSPEELEQSLIDRFSRVVSQSGERLAVDDGTRQVTYRDLDRWANGLARRLIESPAESPVVLMFAGGADMVAAILGTLQTGRPYLPLDVSAPSGHLESVLRQSGARVVVCEPELCDRVRRVAPSELSLIEWESIVPDDGPPIRSARPDSIACILYTSGSTGTPKGVYQNHRNLLRHISNQTSAAQIGCYDRLTLLTAFHLAASLTNLFGALLNGASLFPFRVATRRLDELGDLLTRQRLTIWHSVPTLFRRLCGELPADVRWPDLRLVRLGGESVDRHDLELLRARTGPDCRLQVSYSMTETHTICEQQIRIDTDLPEGALPVGKPLPGIRVQIVDEQGQPVASGESGAIVVAGRQLALGYWQQPELTAQTFTIDPEEPTARRFRTGDYGRLLADGRLVYHGRQDSRVKIRGLRIELGDLEANLAQHPAIETAIVQLCEDPSDDPFLAAYLVPLRTVPQPTEQEFRQWMRDNLAPHLWPRELIFLTALPLTAAGKVDRRALPAPPTRHAQPASPGSAGDDSLESRLTRIWCDVLHRDQIGPDDNFFELGGQSLLAMLAASRIWSQLQIELPVQAIFEAPTIARLADSLRASRVPASHPHVALRRVKRDEDLPLSFAQERLWFLDQLEPGSAAYNIPWVASLRGELDCTALRQVLCDIVQRHEVLRTRFLSQAGQPRLHVRGDSQVPLPITDLRSRPGGERQSLARRRATEIVRQPFNLAEDLLLRAEIIQLADDEYWLVIVVHHIAADAWSLGIFRRELTTRYRAAIAGPAGEGPQLPAQYVDYAVWHRQWLETEAARRQIAYWKQQLAGLPASLELPTDFPRPAVASGRGACREFVLPAELTDRLRSLSRTENATMFMTLLAAWQVLLSRYSRQDDVVVGAPIAGRQHAELEELIGFFVNTLVLRANLSGNPTFRNLLAQVRSTTLAAYAHQDLPFEKLVAELQPERSQSRSPLFQVLFALQNAPRDELELTGLTIRPVTVDTGTAKFDLSLSLRELGSGLRGTLEYSTDLFAADTVDRLIGHYENLLAGIVADPDQPIEALPLLSESERRQLFDVWGGAVGPRTDERCLPECFEAEVQRAAAGVAVVCGDLRITFGELNERANRLAHLLLSQGGGPDVFVGVCVPRSVEMLVAMLAILKAGGAYVPLDPDHPALRIQQVLESTNPVLVITTRTVQASLPAQIAAIVLDDAVTESRLREKPDTNPRDPRGAPLARLTAAAYVMSTSGSTGKPKSVVIEHRALSVFREALQSVLPFGPAQRLLAVTTITFDISVLELLITLSRGTQVVLATRDVVRDPELLSQLIRTERPCTLQATPSLFQMLLSCDRECLSGLRILVGGEPLPVELARELTARAASVWNMYGPTEATIWATVHPVGPADTNSTAPTVVSIGRPLPNYRIYLLDRFLRPVPAGLPGELYIAGPALAREYLHQPELTNERFVSDPLATISDQRMYRTGDLARWQPDGTLAFQGRIDHQVKLRGFRIELAEIESVLLAQLRVREAVVVMRDDESRGKFLAAYLVPAGGPAPEIALLQKELSARLPEYMVPATFVVLEQLPRLPNGKLDRRALPAPSVVTPPVASTTETPGTDLQRQVAGIFQNVLGMPAVGLDDDFFLTLGGNSLLAVQVQSQINATFSLRLPLRALFETPRVRGLAERVAAELVGETAASLPKTAISESPRAVVVPPAISARRPTWRGRIYRFIALSQHPVAQAGRKLYRSLTRFTLPTPRVLTMPLRWTFESLRWVGYLLWRLLICEPLFKSYCRKCGRGVRTGVYIHWVMGQGDLIVGDHVMVDGKCSFTFAARFSETPTLSIGNNSAIGHNGMFTVGKQITIGRKCRIASDVWMFDSGGHSLNPDDRLTNQPLDALAVRPIEIGDNVWIGRRVVIFPGVTIGEGSVIVACSVVMASVPPYSLVSGYPAKVLAQLPRQDDSAAV